MRRIFTLLSAIFFLSTSAISANAQSYHVEADTVYDTIAPGSGINVILDTIVATGSVTLQWKVVGTNFPTDWLAGTGVCDDSICYNSSSLWPSGALKTSKPYSSAVSAFDMQVDLDPSTSLGTFYYRVRINNQANPTDTAYETYVVTKLRSASVPQLPVAGSEISLYPNPATNEINLIYDAALDVKSVAVYNIIGKVMSVYKVAGNSANINVDNMPPGIYFVRIVNTSGNVVAIKKFTKR